MKVLVEVFREADGRLQGVLETADARRHAFVSTLDLLRVLEGLELTRDPATGHGSEAGHGYGRHVEVQDG